MNADRSFREIYEMAIRQRPLTRPEEQLLELLNCRDALLDLTQAIGRERLTKAQRRAYDHAQNALNGQA